MKVKLLFILVFVAVAIVGCRTEVGVFENGRYSKSMKSAFIEDFKTLSFCKCVELGNNSKLNLKEEDVSCLYPDYLYSEWETINQLAQLETDKIRLDSVNRNGHVAEGMEGKQVISKCLEFYKSKELDAVAKERFRISEKSMQSIGRN